MDNKYRIEPEYIYVTIPAEYVCVYHRILAMLADFGEEMLKDCKASCTERNSGVIECFNMFNAAIAARELGQDKKAALIINYVKAKINQIYKGKDNSTSFVFPVDKDGRLKAFVSCNDRPTFWINTEDMKLYKKPNGLGFDEVFELGPEDEAPEVLDFVIPAKLEKDELDFRMDYNYDEEGNLIAGLTCYQDETEIGIEDMKIDYYFDNKAIVSLNDVKRVDVGNHDIMIVATYKDKTIVHKFKVPYIKNK